jgi:hypothetical protein
MRSASREVGIEGENSDSSIVRSRRDLSGFSRGTVVIRWDEKAGLRRDANQAMVVSLIQWGAGRRSRGAGAVIQPQRSWSPAAVAKLAE